MSGLKDRLFKKKKAIHPNQNGGPVSLEAEIKCSAAFYAHFESGLMSCLQRGGHFHFANIGSKTKKGFPYEEKKFSSFLSKSAFQVPHATSEALQAMSEAYQQIADLKSTRDSNTLTDVIRPINEGTIKELNNLQKLQKTLAAAENEFLAAEKNLKKVGDQQASEKRQAALSVRDGAKQNLAAAEAEFKRDEEKRIMIFNSMAEIQLEYHKRTLETFQKLVADLNSTRNNTNSSTTNDTYAEPNGSAAAFPTAPADNLGFTAIVHSDNNLFQTPDAGKQLGGKCEALYDFVAESDEDLPLIKNDIITGVRKVDDQWFHGECNGRKGHFPIEFVRIIDPVD